MTTEGGRLSDSRVRVLIVDDRIIVRKGIRALLAEADGFEVWGKRVTVRKRWRAPRRATLTSS